MGEWRWPEVGPEVLARSGSPDPDRDTHCCQRRLRSPKPLDGQASRRCCCWVRDPCRVVRKTIRNVRGGGPVLGSMFSMLGRPLAAAEWPEGASLLDVWRCDFDWGEGRGLDRLVYFSTFCQILDRRQEKFCRLIVCLQGIQLPAVSFRFYFPLK